MLIRMTNPVKIANAGKEIRAAEEIMKETDQLKEELRLKKGAMDTVFSEIVPELMQKKEAAIKDIAALRSPKRLNTRVAVLMSEGELKASVWEKASAAERVKMMEKMFDTMMDEMQIPENCRASLVIVDPGTNVLAQELQDAGDCKRFLGLNGSGKFTVMEKPVVEVSGKLKYKDYEPVLGALYHQAIKVMQQATCVEPAGTYSDVGEQAKWVKEIKDQISGKAAEISNMDSFAAKAENDMLSFYRSYTSARGVMNQTISFK